MKNTVTYITLAFSFFILHSSVSQSWEPSAIGVLPGDYGVYDISAVNENVVWAVAYDVSIGNSSIPLNHLTKVIKTMDGGETWEVYDVGEAVGRISFDIHAFDENTALITTQDFNNGAGRGVFKTEDGGNSWSEKFHHTAAGIWIRFFNDKDGVIINGHHIAITRDAGDSWELVSAVPTLHSGEHTLLYSGNNSCEMVGDRIWFGTSSGRVYRSLDKGQSWDVFQTTLGEDAFILSVAFRDEFNGIAIDANAFFPDWIPSFARTTDGGETWENITAVPELALAQIEFIPGTDATLVAIPHPMAFLDKRVSAYSTDFGSIWEVISDSSKLFATQFLSREIGWAANEDASPPDQAALFRWNGEIPVSTMEIESGVDLRISPNPVSGNLKIQDFKNTIRLYRLFASDGDLLQSGNLDHDQSILTMESLPPGMYYLELIFEDGSRASRNIVKAN